VEPDKNKNLNKKFHQSLLSHRFKESRTKQEQQQQRLKSTVADEDKTRLVCAHEIDRPFLFYRSADYKSNRKRERKENDGESRSK
jgi:hypothetical protein